VNKHRELLVSQLTVLGVSADWKILMIGQTKGNKQRLSFVDYILKYQKTLVTAVHVIYQRREPNLRRLDFFRFIANKEVLSNYFDKTFHLS
jgi:hypothetical protein